MIFTLTQYDDGSGPRLQVALGHTTQEGEQTVTVKGIGRDTSILAADIDTLIAGLRAAQQHFYREGNDA